MTMDILPAIDLRDGKVVRLRQGDYDRQTTYADDPAKVARQLASAGASWIHVVDLDAARTGQVTSLHAARKIAETPGVQVEFGGGVRDEATVDLLLEAGMSRLVVGSAALRDWSWFEGLCSRGDLAGRIALGLDAREGRLAVQGWTETLSATAVDVARRASDLPLGAIVHTDIARDGMLAGVNIAATEEVIAATHLPIVASGGVASIDDVSNCLRIGCGGVIIGRAWYEGKIDLSDALKLAGKNSPLGG
jgi:phosphoribosylformimino-5-aminoimidazole carboxamide ribotide isomerase